MNVQAPALRWVVCATLMLLMLIATCPYAAAQAPDIQVQEIPFGDINTSGKAISSCWGGLGKDSTDHIYIAMGIGTPASDDVGIFQYNSATGQRRFLDTLKHVTQLEGNFDSNETIAKVHTDMMLFQGKLYFSTHDFHDISPGYHRGGHFFAYDPSADHFEDLSKTDTGGVSAPAQGLIAMDIMPIQQKLIGFTYPDGDVAAYDLASHHTDYWQGNPNPDAGVSRHIFTSNDNFAYITYGQFAGPQPIYAMNVTTGAITSPAGFTLRLAQIPAVAHAADGDRVFLLNWDYVYLFHKATKQFEALGELLAPSDRGLQIYASTLVLSQDETKLYAIAEGYPGGGSTYVWWLYEFDVQTKQSNRIVDLAPQMNVIHGGQLGSILGAVLDSQGRAYVCAAEGYLLQLTGLPSSSPPLTTEAPIAWWKFEEGVSPTAADSAVGAAYPLTINGGLTWQAGRVGTYALHCDGAGGYAEQSTPFPVNTNQYTTMIWVKGTGVPGTNLDIVLKNGLDSETWGFSWGHPDPGSQQAWWHRDSGGGYWTAKLTTSFVGNVWYHVAFTYDGTNLRGYLNGVLQVTTPVSSILPASGAFRVCRGGVVTTFVGNIDEGKVWNRALTTAQVQAEYRAAGFVSGRHKVVGQ